MALCFSLSLIHSLRIASMIFLSSCETFARLVMCLAPVYVYAYYRHSFPFPYRQFDQFSGNFLPSSSWELCGSRFRDALVCWSVRFRRFPIAGAARNAAHATIGNPTARPLATRCPETLCSTCTRTILPNDLPRGQHQCNLKSAVEVCALPGGRNENGPDWSHL